MTDEPLTGSCLFLSPLLYTDLTTKLLLKEDVKKPTTYTSLKAVSQEKKTKFTT